MKRFTKLVFISNECQLRWTIRSIFNINESIEVLTITEDENSVKDALFRLNPDCTVIMFDLESEDVPSVKQWLWRLIRMVSTAPFIALGFTSKKIFCNTNIEFKQVRAHHEYLEKPINLYLLCKIVDKITPVADVDRVILIKRYGSIERQIRELVSHDIKNKIETGKFEDCITIYEKIKFLLPYSNIEIEIDVIDNEIKALREHRDIEQRKKFANKLAKLAEKASKIVDKITNE